MAYTQTSRAVAADAEVGRAYVQRLAREGLLEHVTASDGTRLYPADASNEVRRIKTERLARRGNRAA